MKLALALSLFAAADGFTPRGMLRYETFEFIDELPNAED